MSSHLECDVVDGEGDLRLQELAARLVHILPQSHRSSGASPLGCRAQTLALHGILYEPESKMLLSGGHQFIFIFLLAKTCFFVVVFETISGMYTRRRQP